jgi:hypothetical protein
VPWPTETNSVAGAVLAIVSETSAVPAGAVMPVLATAPFPARIEARDADGRVVASTKPDDAGRYRLALPVGRYTLVVVPDSGVVRCPARTVDIAPGEDAQVDVTCSTPYA